MPLLTRRLTVRPHSKYHPILEIAKPVGRGTRGESVRFIQEWLVLHHVNIDIDGDYGPATEQAVKDFQGGSGVLGVTGTTDPETYAMLVRPMVEALRPITPPDGATLGQMIAACALQHLDKHAREVGGQNRGPWVRLYLQGRERPIDKDLPKGYDAWCAGFAATMVAHASKSMSAKTTPLGYHTNCNKLAAAAQDEKRFLRGDKAKPEQIPTGSLMLIRNGNRRGWHHTGVVTQALPDYVLTIEGNSSTRASESPTGEVCRQRRYYGRLDFIVFD
jgi:hypothetical protein